MFKSGYSVYTCSNVFILVGCMFEINNINDNRTKCYKTRVFVYECIVCYAVQIVGDQRQPITRRESPTTCTKGRYVETCIINNNVITLFTSTSSILKGNGLEITL